METVLGVNRRSFLRGAGTVLVGGAVLGGPAFGEEETKEGSAEKPKPPKPTEVQTNLAEFMKVPKADGAIPGPFPGRVVQVTDPRSLTEDETVDAAVVREMVAKGIRKLTGAEPKAAFAKLLSKDDVVGLKVNPVGAPRISTQLEVVEAVVRWLVDAGLPKRNIVIWDRFEGMLADAGFTKDSFPGVRIEALQIMDPEGEGWRTEDGRHVSEARFDMNAYYFAKGVIGKDVRGYQSNEFYLNQHVFNNEYSYFGKLITKELTKIINLAAFKNTGNGLSMATKNLGYGAVCNTGRLHQPLFFHVNTHICAAPWVRDKLVLNITDGLRGQYDGGPGRNDQFVYPNSSLYFATDPFALDMVCHQQIVAKRKEMKVTVNEHPRFTQYLHDGEKLGLGIADPAKIEHVVVSA
jgi:hypothetical protein